MKNNIFKKISLAVLALVAFSSCSEDDLTNKSQISSYSPATITMSSNVPSVVNFSESAIDEDDTSTNTVTITATLAETQPVTAIIDLVKDSGNTDTSDFTLGTITIPAGSLSGSANITILKTGNVEGDENFVVKAVSRGNFNLTDFQQTINIVDDYINDVLNLEFSWSGNITKTQNDAEITMDLCKLDFDFLLFDAGFNNLGYLAGTGDCPETAAISGLPDGTYYIVSDLYNNPYSDLGFTDTVTITTSVNQEFFPETSTTLDLTAYTLDNKGSDQGNSSSLQGVAILTVKGYSYTISPF